MTTKYGTISIGRRAAENVLHSVRFAAECGRPINSLITISFAALDIDNEDADRVFQSFYSRVMRGWRYRRQVGLAQSDVVGAFCHANPAGSRHVHWLAHVSPEDAAEFELLLAKLLRKVTRRVELGDALHIKPVGAAGSAAKYVLRGIDPAFAEYLHIRAANEGLVLGRRTGVSRSISKTARRRAGWKRKRSA